MALTVASVDAIRERLAAIPAKDDSARELTRQEALTRMADEIQSLRGRGYSWKEVASIVSREGCQVTPGALKTGLSRRGLTPKPKRRRPESPPSAPAAAAPAATQAALTTSAEKPTVAKQVAPPAAAPERSAGTFTAREDTTDI